MLHKVGAGNMQQSHARAEGTGAKQEPGRKEKLIRSFGRESTILAD